MNDKGESRGGRRYRGRHRSSGQHAGGQHTGGQHTSTPFKEEERQQAKQPRRPNVQERSRTGGQIPGLLPEHSSNRTKPSGRVNRRNDNTPIHSRKIESSTCARCGQPIQDMAAAIADKGTGVPVHFDCVLEFLQKSEELNPGEKIIYIGQGRFAVIFLENPHDTRKFKIIRIIEWEDKEKKQSWRTEISGVFTQIQ